MTLKVTRQTTEEWGSYLWCPGCGCAASPGTVLEGNAILHPPEVSAGEPRWIRLCNPCLDTLEAWLTGPRGSTVLVP